MADCIYLDYQASTPIDSRVRDAMLPWLSECYGNPHAQHSFGQKAQAAVQKARQKVAAVLGAQENEIIFTSGATESNNLAIKGASKFVRQQDGARRHIITLATEHKSVLETCADAEGFETTVLPVQPDGMVDVRQIADALRPDTLLVSVMAVNNETGITQPLAEIGALCRANGSYFHVDAAQALGKLALDVEAMRIDLLSLSGHKAYAPQGVGALFVRRQPRVRIAPLFTGGGQERSLRSGTVATPLVVALGEAVQIAEAERVAEQTRLAQLEQIFLSRLDCDYVQNNAVTHRVSGCLNLGFDGVDVQALRNQIPQLACSGSSSCSSGSGAPSHVLLAMGIEAAALRIGFGRFSTESQAEQAGQILSQAVTQLAKAA